MNTKQIILESAMQVLIDEGFAAMTQTRVAKVAGIGQGLLTYHFPKRNDLLKAVVEESKRKISKTMMQVPQHGLTIDSFTDICFKLSIDKSFIALMLALTSAAIDDASLRDWFTETDKQSRDNLIEVLTQNGYQVEEQSAHLFRASLIGSAFIHVQKGNTQSEKHHSMVVKLAVTQLLKSATRI